MKGNRYILLATLANDDSEKDVKLQACQKLDDAEKTFRLVEANTGRDAKKVKEEAGYKVKRLRDDTKDAKDLSDQKMESLPAQLADV